MPVRELCGWGRFPRSRSAVCRPERIREAVPPGTGGVLPRGLGRSYGDAAMLEGGTVILLERLDRFLSFDSETGVLRAEAGASLAEVLDTFLPRGWFPPVTPGTKHVTLGGCMAADVHGKNHHRRGAFGAHVDEIEIVLADRSRRRCSPTQDADLFWATVGGMGLTGIITEVTLRLSPVESAHVVAEHRKADGVEEIYALLEDPAWDDETSIAWVDVASTGVRFGRGIVMRGHHAAKRELPTRVKDPLRRRVPPVIALPFDLPSGLLRRRAIATFNEIYHRLQARKREAFLTGIDPYFYPLDVVGCWNRVYGRSGFTQYQCVLPISRSREGIPRLLEEIRKAGCFSTLAVLKRFGESDPAPLSFPMAGYTIALDFPLADPAVLPLLDRLDALVLEHAGRVYLAKDARLRPETFRGMYPRLEEFLRAKRAVDPENRFRSDLSTRLSMVGAA